MHHIFAMDKGPISISKLGELWLAVAALIFHHGSSAHLEIPLNTADHEHLLEFAAGTAAGR